jgi:hypothetical protein
MGSTLERSAKRLTRSCLLLYRIIRHQARLVRVAIRRDL